MPRKTRLDKQVDAAMKIVTGIINKNPSDIDFIYTIISMSEDKIKECQQGLAINEAIVKHCKGALQLAAVERYWTVLHPDWRRLKVGDKLLAFEGMKGAAYDDLSRYTIDTVFIIHKIALITATEDETRLHVYAYAVRDNKCEVDMSVELANVMYNAYDTFDG